MPRSHKRSINQVLQEWMGDHVSHRYKRKKTASKKLSQSAARQSKTTRRKSASRSRKSKRSRSKKGSKKYGHGPGMPAWFRTLAKTSTPDRVAGQYGATMGLNITNPANKKAFTFYKNLAIVDIDTICKKYVGANSSTAAASDAKRFYLSNKKVRHEFRNACNTACELQWYQLTPRRDIPATNVPAIAPSSSLAYATGGIAGAPLMYTQGFTDEVAITGNKIAQNDIAATPFMSPALCSLFKIRPLEFIRLEPGETYQRHEEFKGPLMISYNKFGLMGNATNTIAGSWEVLKQTPLLFCYLKGTPSHDISDMSIVQEGLAQVDYIQTFSYEVWKFDLAQVPLITNPIDYSTDVTVALRQVDEVLGVDANEGLDA